MTQTTLDKFQNKTTIKKELVYDVKNERTRYGCFGCEYCNDTGYSWVCTKTDEKLEGFDTMEDKRNKNKETFLDVNIMVTLGKRCPFPVVKKESMTKIRYDVDLTYIAKFVEDETCYVIVNDDDIDENELRISVQWIEGGYADDDAHRDWVLKELSEITNEIENKFNVKTKDGDCEYEREEIIISL